ncbi:META domain containing protein [Trypanosoma grayi]|uniref:META domain containing protein n=1 Tax=Trypanosoma grayi TaxID=71804 RepID=UPI0004F461FD|nr:META domain containing protein [Trypanosoma grayi]KEG11146.1 META domain containing protein [Trypanosoma grayi]
MDKAGFCGKYHLERFDDTPCSAKVALALRAESEGIEVVAKVANTLQGQMKFDAGKLSGLLVSTMMMGSEEEMKLEAALTTGFEGGFNVTWAADTLTLAGEQNTFVFERDLSLERLIGEYTLHTFNGESVSMDNAGLVVAEGSEGCVTVVAQFTNSLRGELKLEDGVLQGAVASTAEEAEGVTTMEERFEAGMGRGVKVTVEGKCLTLKDDDSTFVYLRLLLPSDLAGEYVLQSLNGATVEGDEQITLALCQDENKGEVSVFAKVSNTLRGKAELVKDVLRGPLISTRMMGSEAEMLVEAALSSGFDAGFLCSAEAGQLTLRCGDNTLVYTKVPVVPYENGKPTYLGESVSPCFKGHGNGLLFRIINTAEGKWAFYNDTQKYRMRVVVTFGSRSKLEGLGSTGVTVNEDGRHVADVTVEPGMTEMFVAGHVNGYSCSYDALPL